MKWGVYPLVNVSVLELDESCTDGSDVTLLIGESNPSCTLRVFELWISVDPGITDSTIQTIHNHGQLNWSEREGERKTGKG